MIGLADRERVDEELYDDFETTKAREVCTLVILFLIDLLRLVYVLQGENISD